MKRVLILIVTSMFFEGYSQTTVNPNSGDAYQLFGPNSSWGAFFQVGGNGRVTNHAGIFATNGNLHLDSKNGSFKTYINHYSGGHTILNSQGGFVGIGTSIPSKPLHIMSASEHHQIRIQGTNDKHAWMQFYPSGAGVRNWQIGANTNGFSVYDLVDSSYKFTITNSGTVGIGTTTPSDKLQVKGTTRVGDGNWGALIIDGKDENDWLLNAHNSGELFAIRTQLDGQNPWSHNVMTINRTSGNIGIGTSTPDAKLAVNGDIHAIEVRVDLVGWPDYVFNEDYDLPTLAEMEKHIKEKGHLPNIPSAKEVAENGIELGEMNKLLLEKIEELTLYVIQQQKEIVELKIKMNNQ